MAIVVKHAFVSEVVDSADEDLIQPSHWNADHTITGLGAAAEAGVKRSVEIDGTGIQLVGDEDAPGNNKLFGTSGAGARGWLDAATLIGTVMTAAPKFRAWRSSAQSCANTSYTTIIFDTEVIDNSGSYNPATGVFTPPAGTYLFVGAVRLFLNTIGSQLAIALDKNGTAIFEPNVYAAASGAALAIQVLGIAEANGTDAFSLKVWHNDGTSRNITGNERMSFFAGFRISP